MACLVEETAVKVVGGDGVGLVGEDGSISIGGSPDAMGVLGLASSGASGVRALVRVSAVDALDRG